jgi:hypothetical protein
MEVESRGEGMTISITDRKKRLDLHLAVAVQGEDEAGRPFREETLTRNISGSGISFESRRHLPIGGRIHLSITIPAQLQKHFGGKAVYGTHAVVCRVERFEDAQVSRIGARFVGQG